ncbi:hypothetical protein AUI06_02010 [archaeon 13_2_20CM_2_52_21]|nr:MAG: hypothetical protein AUI06_02010 [archaeon 13_2_20CM_2_52_21]
MIDDGCERSLSGVSGGRPQSPDRSEQRVKADMAETKQFPSHAYEYIKTKMTTTDFDQALIDSWEIVLQSPDVYVLLRKAKT